MAGPLLQFPLDLYLRMRQEGGNVLLSPWHLACMLVVMYHGSGGDTRQQIARVLCTDDDGEIVSRFDCHASHLLCRDYRKARHTHSGRYLHEACLFSAHYCESYYVHDSLKEDS
ncbi:hypothetical protein HPB51_007590 [Rhipicephalus microplus]|uniref:Serpin domain-containing protein n=1 Tax=Rhipicephalus microplus TaxID=6941 RepID=A0A9J6D4F7_RHIMP|nr:hypothetical protein HPB51_007590 [Rhipicephalus microplus]